MNTSSNEKGIGHSPSLNPRKSESVDDETRSEFAKLKTRLFILESKVEMLLSQTQTSKGKPMAKKNDPSSVNPPVGHVECIFPRAFPVHSLTHIANYLRGVEPVVIGDALQHVGCSLGSAGALMGPGPVPVGASSEDVREDPSDLSDEQLAGELEGYVATANAPQAVGDESAAFPQWLVPIIFEALMRIWKEWQTK